MRDTGSFAWDEMVPNLAVGYGHDPYDALKVEPRRSNITALPYRGTPAGGGYSTAPDLVAFAAALRGHRLLGPAMTETVTSPKVAFPGWGKYGYGVLSYAVEGRDVRGHSGGHVGISSALQMFWDGSYTVIVLDNFGLGNGVAGEIVGLLAAQEA
jgi:CubicO group peptidase (beta-lactamase class C family)